MCEESKINRNEATNKLDLPGLIKYLFEEMKEFEVDQKFIKLRAYLMPDGNHPTMSALSFGKDFNLFIYSEDLESFDILQILSENIKNRTGNVKLKIYITCLALKFQTTKMISLDLEEKEIKKESQSSSIFFEQQLLELKEMNNKLFVELNKKNDELQQLQMNNYSLQNQVPRGMDKILDLVLSKNAQPTQPINNDSLLTKVYESQITNLKDTYEFQIKSLREEKAELKTDLKELNDYIKTIEDELYSLKGSENQNTAQIVAETIRDIAIPILNKVPDSSVNHNVVNPSSLANNNKSNTVQPSLKDKLIEVLYVVREMFKDKKDAEIISFITENYSNLIGLLKNRKQEVLNQKKSILEFGYNEEEFKRLSQIIEKF